MDDWRDTLKDKILSHRLAIVTVIMSVFMLVLILRLFVLQIVRGSDYQENYNLKIEKIETINASRGNIYDRNGVLLAYNELAYAITIEDSGTYTNRKEKNKLLNAELATLIDNIEKCGDSIDNDFGILYSAKNGYTFKHQGTALQRFRADVFGYVSPSDLKYNPDLGFNEAEATPDQIMGYLYGSDRYNVSEDYPENLRYEIVVVRYNMGLNSYQKYIATTVASNVNDYTVAYVEENMADLIGVAVEQQPVRTYIDAEAFSNIIGYTGKISTEEYEEYSKESDDYALTDTVGKVGIEQYMNSVLAGKKGERVVYVDSVGNLIDVTSETSPVSGGNVYLSIDRDLQVQTYKLLEAEIAGILYSKIENIREYKPSENSSSSNIVIPIYEVYYALINNNLIDREHFESDEATANEKEVLRGFQQKKKSVSSELKNELLSSNLIYSELPEEYQEYTTYFVKKLRSDGILNSEGAAHDDEIQEAWSSENLSVRDYLYHALEQNWIDITKITETGQYVDTDEIYESLVDYIIDDLGSDDTFEKMLYHYAILEDIITGTQLSLILYDQGILPEDHETVMALSEGTVTAYTFLKDKIKSLEITPAQLALDPCSGSSVVMDVNTGELLACVTYPGYDNNRLSSADNDYFLYLNINNSKPLYNYATQQRTAPGSTFKLCTATAGIAEGVIDPSTEIICTGQYMNVSNEPKCWIYPGSHGEETLEEAIRDSCNYYFYEVGYRLAGSSIYSDKRGIERLDKYAKEYGLDEPTGVEIEEYTSSLADEYPVMAAIGQSNHNITTVALARYCAALANHGTVYNLTLLDHVTDADGNTVENYGPTVYNKVDALDAYGWSLLNTGMRMVVENNDAFKGFPVEMAGKTGTAQEVSTRADHILFIGYAPYTNPKIAVATRIAHGYASTNAADLSKNIVGLYYNVDSSKALLDGGAIMGVSTSTVRTD